MQLLSKFNKAFRFLLCVIDIFSKYAWVVPLKDKKSISIVNAFQKILKESNRKPNKIWVDKGSEFYNNSFKKWLQDNDTGMYSIHNEGKSVIAERFIRTLKNKIYKYMTSISKNMCIDKLDDIVKKYNNTYHTSIKMKPVDVKDNTNIDFKNEVNDKNPKFKVLDHVRISKYKNIFAKGYMPNWSEEIFIIKKIKNTVLWTYVINDLNGEEIIGIFYENELQKTDEKEFRIEKVLKKKGDKLYIKWVMIILLIVGLIKKTLYKMNQYFPKPYEPFGGDINVTVDLYNYATKDDIKNITHIDTSSFALKKNLANLKSEVDKLDVDKLKPIPTDLSKLSDVVKNDVFKKTDYNKLVTKVDNIDTSGLVKKTDYNTKISEIEDKVPDTSGLAKKTDYNTKVTEIEDKIPDTSGLVKKTAYNTKITEIEGKIPDISGLATKTALTTVENKIPSISNLATKTALTTVENKIPSINSLVKKTDYNTKITDTENKLNNHNHDKYVATSESNTLAADVFNARLAQANLITKTDFDAKLLNLNRKITANKRKHLLNDNDLSYYRGKQYFDEGSGKQNYLVFLLMRKYFKLNSVFDTVDYLLSWQSKGLSNESIKPPTTSDSSVTPELNFYGTKTRVKFTRSCLKQSSHIFTHKKVVNISIVYELAASSSHNSDPTIKSCLFGAVTLTKNADIEKYKYSGYGIGFDTRSSFSFPSSEFGQNVLIFGADMSTSIHIDNKKKNILVLGRGPMQEKMYLINFTVTKKKFCLSLHYNGRNSYLFVNGTEIIKFKTKDSAIAASPLCLGNISKD